MIYTKDLNFITKLRVWRDIILYRFGFPVSMLMISLSEPHMIPRKGCRCLGCIRFG